jgi:hypothetical protein
VVCDVSRRDRLGSGIVQSDCQGVILVAKKDNNYILLFNESIRGLFKDALRISLNNPGMVLFLKRTIKWQA